MTQKNDVILSKEYTEQFRKYLQCLFALPLVRTTIREFHSNLVRFLKGDEVLVKAFMEGFLSGEIADAEEHVRALVQEYSPLVRLAKEVHDRGDFLNFVTTDQVTLKEQVVFQHYLRTVDGVEYRFVSDIKTMGQLMHHLTQRLSDASGVELAQKELEEIVPLLKDAQVRINHALKMAQ